MNFRTAKANDVMAVIDIYFSRRKWLGEKGVNLWQGEGFLEEIKNEVTKALNINSLYVLEQDNKIIGCVILQNSSNNDYWQEDNQNYCYLTRLCVAINEKNKGLGKVILDYCLEECQKLGYEKLRLDCRADNSHLPEFYSKYGFQEIGRKKFPNGDGTFDADSILMEMPIIKKNHKI